VVRIAGSDTPRSSGVLEKRGRLSIPARNELGVKGADPKM
jgi:hypothetical protein